MDSSNNYCVKTHLHKPHCWLSNPTSGGLIFRMSVMEIINSKLVIFHLQEAMVEEKDQQLLQYEDTRMKQEQQLIEQHMKIEELQKAIKVTVI